MAHPLADRLREQIETEGPLAFSEFMRAALYDPEDGYYADPEFTTGRKGDFATAPDAGPLMGATLARPIETFAQEEGRLVELGPGSGRLVVDVLEELSEDARANLDVVLVEPFEARQEALAERVEEATGVEPTVLGDLSPAGSGRTFLLANEVLDALPVDVIQQTPDGLEAMHVAVGPDGFERVWQPASSELTDHVAPVADRLPEGGRYEFAHGLEELLRSVAESLDPGVAVLLDYGGRFKDLWKQGTDGTLRGFRGHDHADPLEAPGETDVTADVDFSRVMGLSEAMEMETAAYGGQDRLLVHLGMVEVARRRGRLADVKQLVVPGGGGFGERFRVLVLDQGGLADELDLAVDLDDPDVWTRAMEGMRDEEGLAGLGADELL